MSAGLIEKLRAAIALTEQHAEKDLWTVARCTANPSEWHARYGFNLPYSEMVIGEDVEDVILRAVTPNHQADIFAVSRAMRLLEGRAKATMRQVAAHRKILDEIVSEANWLDLSVDLDRRVGLRDESVEPLLGNVLVRILAEAYGIEVDDE